MFNVEQYFLLFAVVSNERVKRIAVRNPANQARVGRQRDDRVSLNTININICNDIKLFKKHRRVQNNSENRQIILTTKNCADQ